MGRGKLKRHGQTTPVIVMECPRCRRGLVLSQGEATPPQPGLVPYCGDCMQEGHNVQMRATIYRSGPPTLIV